MTQTYPDHLNPRMNVCRFFGAGLLAFTLAGAASGATPAANNAERPNIIIIYADDLGYGDVSCYGSTAISTPNIDRLATHGLLFTDGHAPASTCTPSRYSLLTGRAAFRTPGVAILQGDAAALIKPGETTLASALAEIGYQTSIFGKWHLGLGTGDIDWNKAITPGPMDVGFTEQFILPATLDRVPCVYLEGNRVRDLDPADPITVSYAHRVGTEPTGFSNPELLKYKASPQHSGTIINGVSRIGYMTGGKAARWNDEAMPDVLSGKAAEFIHKNRETPFFIYYAAPEPHVPRIPAPRFAGKTKLGPRGDVIVQLDWEVGQILAALERDNLTENTLIILSSDNGPVLNDGYEDGAVRLNGNHRPSGPYSGGKYGVLEGGTRVPFIVSWPKRIKPGVSHALISHVDFLATLSALTGRKMAAGEGPDSFDLLPVLLGDSTQGRPLLLEEGFADMGYREGDWKITQEIKKGSGKNVTDRFGKVRLYNVAEDLGEKIDLAKQQPERVAQLQAGLRAMLNGQQSRP